MRGLGNLQERKVAVFVESTTTNPDGSKTPKTTGHPVDLQVACSGCLFHSECLPYQSDGVRVGPARNNRGRVEDKIKYVIGKRVGTQGCTLDTVDTDAL